MSNHIMQRELKRKNIKLFSKKKRPKTFKSEDSAKAYAEKNKIKKYSLKNLRLNPNVRPKFQIVVVE